jgi:hypothetical protein
MDEEGVKEQGLDGIAVGGPIGLDEKNGPWEVAGADKTG